MFLGLTAEQWFAGILSQVIAQSVSRKDPEDGRNDSLEDESRETLLLP